MGISQEVMLMEFFKKHPNKDIPHPQIVDWVTAEYQKRTGKVFRDPDRGIRKLYQNGYLIKVGKGVYRYEPDSVKKQNLEDFTQEVKKAIFERDKYRCVFCGRGLKDGIEIHADHIIPKDRGGKATLENGQTLCSEHNILKKNYGTVDFLRKYSEKMLKRAEKLKDKRTISLFKDI